MLELLDIREQEQKEYMQKLENLECKRWLDLFLERHTVLIMYVKLSTRVSLKRPSNNMRKSMLNIMPKLSRYEVRSDGLLYDDVEYINTFASRP